MTEADILATTYDDTCTVYRPFKKVLESGETAFQDGLQGQVVYRPGLFPGPSNGRQP